MQKLSSSYSFLVEWSRILSFIKFKKSIERLTIRERLTRSYIYHDQIIIIEIRSDFIINYYILYIVDFKLVCT
jgi:hypothetical protein